MLIDFHTHIFPDKIAERTIKFLADNCNGTAHTDGTEKGLISAMERADADIAVSLPVLTKPSQFESVMKYAIDINEKYKNEKKRIISFGGIHPACEDIKGKMKLLKEKGFLGVKIHPDFQDTFIDDCGYVEILKCARDLDMIVVTHAGVDDGYEGKVVKCPPEAAKILIDKVGHKKFVLAHYGGHKRWEQVLKILAGTDVYFDTAFTLHEISEDLFKKILEAHGAEKVLFASDCPWQDIVSHKNILKSYKLDKETEDRIFYKNALKLLNISE